MLLAVQQEFDEVRIRDPRIRLSLQRRRRVYEEGLNRKKEGLLTDHIVNDLCNVHEAVRQPLVKMTSVAAGEDWSADRRRYERRFCKVGGGEDGVSAQRWNDRRVQETVVSEERAGRRRHDERRHCGTGNKNLTTNVEKLLT
jgi:hypothetical protein